MIWEDFTISGSRGGAGTEGKEREGGHEFVAKSVPHGSPLPPKLGPGPFCTPSHVATGIKPETGAVSHTLCVQPGYHAQGLPVKEPTHCPLPQLDPPDLPASPALGPQAVLLEDSLSLLTQTVLMTHSGGLFSSVWAETVARLLPILQTEGWVGKEVCVWGQEEPAASVLTGVPSSPLYPLLLSCCPCGPST